MSSYNEILKKNPHFQGIFTNKFDNINQSQLETISLIFEQDHFHMILEGMNEAKKGLVTSFNSAFSDIN